MLAAIASLPHTLYRFYDAEGRLLYIGIAVDFLSRWRKHRKRDWWPLVARMDIVSYPNRAAAQSAETRAIKTERPLRNIQHNRPVLTTGVIALDPVQRLEARLAGLMQAPWDRLHPVIREARLLLLSMLAAGSWVSGFVGLTFGAMLAGRWAGLAACMAVFLATHAAWRLAVIDGLGRKLPRQTRSRRALRRRLLCAVLFIRPT